MEYNFNINILKEKKMSKSDVKIYIPGTDEEITLPVRQGK